jgi:diacylglycerol kinase family enzyme
MRESVRRRVERSGLGTSILVCNRHAGASTEEGVSRVLTALGGFGLVEMVETTPGGAAQYLGPRLRADVERVYVFGGDGTVGDVAGVLRRSDMLIGVIPCGTTNVLARECRIPLEPLKAVQALGPSHCTRSFQTWSTGSGTLLLGLGVGFDARLMWRTPISAKRRWGLFAVALTGLREALRYDFPLIEIEGEDATGHDFRAQGTFVLVGNTERWAGEGIMMPGADPSDDLLDVVIFSSRRRSDLMAFWGLAALPGSHHLRVPGVRIVRARRLHIDSSEGVEVHINGDPHSRTPVRLAPSGLVQMIVPQ